MPRDPGRIETVLDLIRQAWQKTPDQRLFQLLHNIARSPTPHPETFSLEDDVLQVRISNYLGSGSFLPVMPPSANDELMCWADGASVQIKAVSAFGDPVDCSAEEALQFSREITDAVKAAGG